MAFAGAVEMFDRRRISGWAGFSAGGTRAPITFELRFKDRAPIAPTRTTERAEGVGFVFELPAEFHDMVWADFVAAYEGVVASTDSPAGPNRWRVPMYKSVLINRDLEPRTRERPGNPVVLSGNRTTLGGSRLKDYSLGPVPGGRLAAFTIAYNEALMIPIWAKYYAEVVGPENLYILDHASDVDYTTMVPKGVKVIRLPRDAFDNFLIARTVAMFQRFLLESYDSVLYTDSDEFVCADPELAAGRTLRDVLLQLDVPIGITTGFNLWHDLANESAYDPAKPLLSQRRMLARETHMDKPLIARVPLSWVPGFHSALEGGTRVPGLYMVHLRWFDLDHALVKGGHYRESKWNPFDVEHGIAAYQRLGAEEIVHVFRGTNASFTRQPTQEFGPDAQRTFVPDWMKEAVWI